MAAVLALSLWLLAVGAIVAACWTIDRLDRCRRRKRVRRHLDRKLDTTEMSS